MIEPPRVALTGVGYAVPPGIRTNDDPIFDWLKAHQTAGQDLFQGYKERRVLARDDGPPDLPTTVVDLMVPAAQQAIAAAGLQPGQVDAILGYASVSEYLTPNALAEVHRRLGLPGTCWIVPVDLEEDFNTSLVLAQSLIQAGRATNALVVAGCNWTRFVSYHTPESISVSDGAGAAVVGPTSDPSRFRIVDAATDTKTSGYGVMFMSGDEVGHGADATTTYTAPYFHITPGGFAAVKGFGVTAPAALANRLIARNGLDGPGVALITHQTSRGLIDAWRAAIEPGQYVETLESFANMVSATIPVNLAHDYARIEKDYVLLLDVSAELKTTGVLLSRSG
jgi:3-oxoacyl-[acyl-carrier-protein] synthase III